jgi:hypothetical protein
MSKPARAWVVVGSGCVVGSVVWLIVSPGVLGAVLLAVGVVILVIATIGRLMHFTIPELDVPDTPLRVGEPFSVSYRRRCKRATDVSRIRLELVLRETVEYTAEGRGRDGTYTYTETVTHDDITQDFVVAGRRFEPGQTINENRTFRIPADGMHSFTADHNRIEWYVVAHMDMPKSGDDSWEEKLTVLPELAG